MLCFLSVILLFPLCRLYDPFSHTSSYAINFLTTLSWLEAVQEMSFSNNESSFYSFIRLVPVKYIVLLKLTQTEFSLFSHQMLTIYKFASL